MVLIFPLSDLEGRSLGEQLVSTSPSREVGINLKR